MKAERRPASPPLAEALLLLREVKRGQAHDRDALSRAPPLLKSPWRLAGAYVKDTVIVSARIRNSTGALYVSKEVVVIAMNDLLFLVTVCVAELCRASCMSTVRC